jgi:hypothetical protein
MRSRRLRDDARDRLKMEIQLIDLYVTSHWIHITVC